MAAGNEAVSALAGVVAVVRDENKPRSHPAARPSVSGLPTADPTLATATSIDWHCVAVAETGADFTMHGPVYSTAYGVVNSVVTEYASPAVAARVFAGTATEAEQTDIVARFAADHGTGGWGVETKRKCGL